MSLYKIQSWNPVMFGNNLNQYPMIYISPDITFLEFIRKNQFTVIVVISNTGTIYDNKPILGFVNKSNIVPNCRPNFYEITGFYTVTLQCPWLEMPFYNQGFAQFYGLK